MEIFIDNRQDEFTIDEEMYELIRESILKSLEIEKGNTNYEISISFVTDAEMKELNYNYRGINETTDVLSFPMEDEFGIEDEKIMGDIIISTRQMIKQSKDYNHSIKRELSFLITHSMFHLMGYDHITEEDRNEMRKKEELVLKSLGISRDY